MEIPLNVRYRSGDEAEAIATVVKSGQWSGGGTVNQRVEQQISAVLDDCHVLLTASGTAALELALMALGIGRNDEVILSTFASAGSANAILHSGAIPVYSDIRSDTYNIDPNAIERHITEQTRAIIVSHYGGISADMGTIMTLAEEHGLFVIEDAGYAFDARLNGSPLGTIGHIGCFSFDDNSTIGCGEGGALVTQNDVLSQQARLLVQPDSNSGANPWQQAGGNFSMSAILAALLESQLAKRHDIMAKRRAIWQAYHDSLEVLAANGYIVLPDIPQGNDINFSDFYIRVPDTATRNLLLAQLRARGIFASVPHQPLHLSPYGQQFARVSLSVAETRSSTLLKLPLYPDLSPRAARTIVRTIEKIFAPTQSEYDSLQSTAFDRMQPDLIS